MWQPIDTAPDNVVVLTDRGTAIRKRTWWAKSWFLCDFDGDIPECAEESFLFSVREPKYWMPLPEVPRGE